MHVAPRWYTGHLVAAMLSACAPAQVENQAPRAVPSPDPEPGRDWVTLTRIHDASHEIDARSVVRGANGTFTLRYRARMPAFTNPAGERIDRIEELVEYDCAGGRERTRTSEVKLGSAVVRRGATTGEWSRVTGPHREVFRSICAYVGTLHRGPA